MLYICLFHRLTNCFVVLGYVVFFLCFFFSRLLSPAIKKPLNTIIMISLCLTHEMLQLSKL